VQVPASALRDPRALTHVALPILREDAVVGAVGLALRSVAPADLKGVVETVGSALRGLGPLLAAHFERERVAEMLALAASLLDQEGLAAAAHALCAELARRLGCERVALGVLRRDRMRVLALSTSLRFAEASDTMRDLRAAMEEAAEQDAVIELPAPEQAAPHATRDHEQLLQDSGARRVCTAPLGARGRTIGALTCEWGAAGGEPVPAERVAGAATLSGPILELLLRVEAGPVERARAAWERFAARHLGGDGLFARGAVAAIAALLVLLALLPGTHRISARASLEGRVQRALVAAVPGYLAEAGARAGDLVRAGDVLARLDERDLALERRRWQGQKARLEQEYREALAAQDRTQMSILGAQIEQAAAQLDLAREQLARAAVVAPFDGIVLRGELDRELGSPVEQGEVLFEIAPLDGYRIILAVDERDIAHVAVGQRGQLALTALPGDPLPLAVERITPISSVEAGRNTFRVEAVLERQDVALRPGMEGIAKIDAGRRRLLWIWGHTLVDWIRLGAWSFVP
jgi:RND family efflux transporter MFP subunit